MIKSSDYHKTKTEILQSLKLSIISNLYHSSIIPFGRALNQQRRRRALNLARLRSKSDAQVLSQRNSPDAHTSPTPAHTSLTYIHLSSLGLGFSVQFVRVVRRSRRFECRRVTANECLTIGFCCVCVCGARCGGITIFMIRIRFN